MKTLKESIIVESHMSEGSNFDMKLKLATVVSFIAVLVGFFLDASFLWFPIAVLIAAIISLIVNNKVTCDDLGRAQTTSVFLNFLLSITMFFATFGWMICVGLMIWWII